MPDQSFGKKPNRRGGSQPRPASPLRAPRFAHPRANQSGVRAPMILSGAPCRVRTLATNGGEVNRFKGPDIDPNIDLTPHLSELPMTVTMKIISTFVHAVPSTERIVTEDNPSTFDFNFGVITDGQPPQGLQRSRSIVIPGDEVFAPVKHRKQCGDAFRSDTKCEIP